MHKTIPVHTEGQETVRLHAKLFHTANLPNLRVCDWRHSASFAFLQSLILGNIVKVLEMAVIEDYG